MALFLSGTAALDGLLVRPGRARRSPTFCFLGSPSPDSAFRSARSRFLARIGPSPPCDLKDRLAGLGSIVWPQAACNCFRSSPSKLPGIETGTIVWPEVQKTEASVGQRSSGLTEPFRRSCPDHTEMGVLRQIDAASVQVPVCASYRQDSGHRKTGGCWPYSSRNAIAGSVVIAR